MKATPAADHSKDSKKRWYRRVPWWRVLEGGGILSVIAYAILTYLQWHDLRHNFMVDQRSWLKITVSSWPELTETKPAIIFGTLINIGKSVVTGTLGAAAFEVVEADKPPSFSLKDNIPNITGINPVFPTDSHTFPIQLWNRKLEIQRSFTADEIQRLIDGRAYIATFGMFVYTDQFGLHWHRFCYWFAYAQHEAAIQAAPCVNWNVSGDGKPNVPY